MACMWCRQGVSVNAIAKEFGVSGPALYRYFASRDALLEELVADAYRDLAAAVAAASGAGEPRGGGARATPSSADRFRAFARAYRGWAVAAPHRYRLLYAPPLPGLDAHAERIVDAAQEVMDVLLALLAELDRPALPAPARAGPAARGVEPRPRGGRRRGDRAARRARLVAAARPRQPGARRQLRLDGPRRRAALRGRARRPAGLSC